MSLTRRPLLGRWVRPREDAASVVVIVLDDMGVLGASALRVAGLIDRTPLLQAEGVARVTFLSTVQYPASISLTHEEQAQGSATWYTLNKGPPAGASSLCYSRDALPRMLGADGTSVLMCCPPAQRNVAGRCPGPRICERPTRWTTFSRTRLALASSFSRRACFTRRIVIARVRRCSPRLRACENPISPCLASGCLLRPTRPDRRGLFSIFACRPSVRAPTIHPGSALADEH
jgi:hypothetical protein